MLCTIDMERPNDCRGSILMEFMLVLPLYFLLIGMVFSVGEMGLKVIGLASADRMFASVAGDGNFTLTFSYFREKLFPSDILSYGDDLGMSAKVDTLTASTKTFRSDVEFNCAWGWQAAGKSFDDYALPPWTRGWLQYPRDRFYATAGEGSVDDGRMSGLLDVGRLGRVLMVSKDVGNVRAFNYYTLKRTELARGKDAYRSWGNVRYAGGWDGSGLSKFNSAPVTSSTWYRNVFKEPEMTPDAEKLDQSPDQNRDQGVAPQSKSEYRRKYQLVLLSQ